jgi:hypothetical protein
MHSIGLRVHAINRHGRTDERVDWIGTPERLNELLGVADLLFTIVANGGASRWFDATTGISLAKQGIQIAILFRSAFGLKSTKICAEDEVLSRHSRESLSFLRRMRS